jgi:hypothetical protein
MTAGETKLIFPGLARFYASWRDIAYTLVRVIIGYMCLCMAGQRSPAPASPALAP